MKALDGKSNGQSSLRQLTHTLPLLRNVDSWTVWWLLIKCFVENKKMIVLRGNRKSQESRVKWILFHRSSKFRAKNLHSSKTIETNPEAPAEVSLETNWLLFTCWWFPARFVFKSMSSLLKNLLNLRRFQLWIDLVWEITKTILRKRSARSYWVF